MADIQVVNTDADLSDNTLLTEENAYTITGLHTFSRSTNAPFACISGAAVVTYLDADKLDGQEGAYYLAAANVTGTLAVGKGGTGATSLTDGGVLLGSGTSAVTAMAVLADSEMIVGDGTTDPVAESGATLRTSIGVGTGDSPQFTAVNIGHATDTTVARSSSGNISVEGNLVYRAGGTDVPVADGGTGRSTLTDGGILIGKGTAAINQMAVLSDGEMVVGDGTTDPVAESGATLRTSIGVGTGDSPQFTGVELGHATDTTLTRASSGNVNIEGNLVYRAGGTDVPVADGGTGASTFTDGGILLGSGTGAITALGVAANGQIPIGDGSGDPQLATISPTSNEIEITNSGGSIQVGIVTNPTLGVSNFTGTLANARLPTNVDLGGTLDVTGAATMDSTLTVVNDVAVNTDTIFVDVSEDRVGINTNAPLGPLHIKVSTVSSVTPNANSFIVLEKDASSNYIEFLTPDDVAEGGGFIFKSPSVEGSINFNAALSYVQCGPNLSTSGTLTKGGGSFKISHPLPSMTDTHHLIHSFAESPETLLIYRGTVALVAGQATIDLDETSGMTTGTWSALCRDASCFTSNESGWFNVKGIVSGSTLTIECEDGTSTDTISWMVVANRKDPYVMETAWTDEDGYPIMEPEKPEEP